MSEGRVATYRNPVIPGFHPDPSAVRVGRDYYLVTSSFEYFPGVPIFHSTNLADWRQIGHVLTRREQVDLTNRPSSSGIYAPTLRHHGGTFYMVTTDVRGIGNFYVTATDPAGPWSDPIRLPYGNIDPSLFFDDDGKVYVTVQDGWGDDSHIIQYEIDPRTGEALTEPVKVWQDAEGPWTEGAHLYKINGLYYLMSAAGGTAYEHREVIGRSKHPYGPFEPCPVPILTHRGLPDHDIQCIGHGELIDDADGNWWMLFLGTRPLAGKYSVLGRETFLAPVRWTEDGWPMVDNNEGTVQTVMRVPRLPGDAPQADAERSGQSALQSSASRPAASARPFGEDPVELAWPLGPEWSFLRVADDARCTWDDAAGGLRLTGNKWTLDDEGPAVFACIRQRHHRMEATASLAFRPAHDGEEAGLAVRLNNRGHVFWGVKHADGAARLCLAFRNGDEFRRHFAAELPAGGRVRLKIESDGHHYACFWSFGGEEWQPLAERVPVAALSPEVNGGFTGACVGLYASGAGRGQSAPAVVDAFRYAPKA